MSTDHLHQMIGADQLLQITGTEQLLCTTGTDQIHHSPVPIKHIGSLILATFHAVHFQEPKSNNLP